MPNEYIQHTKDFLDNLLALEPIPTQKPTYIARDESIKAVVFDIYGTLIISASGDVDQAEISVDHLDKALQTAGYQWLGNAKEEHGLQLLALLEEGIKKFQANLKQKGYPYPEIDIMAIWAEIFSYAQEQKWLMETEQADLKLHTVLFELLSNKVYPMPGMKDFLQELFASNIPKGIVSNAQFYTPLIMNYFIQNKVTNDEHVHGFDEDLSFYSYKLLRSKPDVSLFEALAKALKDKYNIEPHEAVFVGNDMLKDVWTASQVGFKTILFAADKRSLRERKDDERCKNLHPDYVIDNLMQIFDIVNMNPIA